MTIKHLGGIFGRNPTFNEVNVDGNIIMADGSGIDFSATSGTGTSELFDDYEEGTFTPTVTSSGGSFTTVSATGIYTLVGRTVLLNGRITITDAGTASGTMSITLPFTNASYDAVGSGFEYATTGFAAGLHLPAAGSSATVRQVDNSSVIATGRRISYAISYTV